MGEGQNLSLLRCLANCYLPWNSGIQTYTSSTQPRRYDVVSRPQNYPTLNLFLTQCRGKRCRNQYRQQVEAAPACTGMLCKLGLLGNKGGLSELLSQQTAGGNQVSQHSTKDAAKTGGRDGISGQLGLLGSGSGLLQSLGINIGKWWKSSETLLILWSIPVT